MATNTSLDYTVGGRIADQNNKVLVGVVVHAYDQDPNTPDNHLGKGVFTDTDGKYSIHFTGKDFKIGGVESGGPDVFIRVYADNKLLGESPVKRNAKRKITINLKVDYEGDDQNSPHDYVVRGTVKQPNRNPIAKARVRALNKRLIGQQDVELGEDRTNELGKYEISYKWYRQVGPDLIIQLVYGAEEVAATSPLIIEAVTEQTVDLIIKHDAFPDFSEYEDLSRRLSPYLDSHFPNELEKESIAYLAGKSRTNPVAIAQFLQASRLENETGIPAEAYYGLFRANLPVSLPALVTQDSATLKQALETAVEANIIAPEVLDKTDELLVKLSEQQIEQILKQPDLLGVTTLGSLLDISRLNDNQKRIFAQLTVEHKGDSRRFWEVLSAHDDMDEGTVASTKLAIQLGTLTLNNLPLMETLLRDPHCEKEGIRSLVGMDEKNWMELIGRHQDDQGNILLPKNLPEVPGQKPEIVYATMMRRMIEDAYPTPTIAAKMKANDFSGAADIKRFLSDNPSFEFRGTGVRSYIHEKNLNLKEEQIAFVESVRRVFDITPRFEKYDTMKPLLADGLTSAYAVRSLGEVTFTTQYSNSLGMAEAAYIYQAASQKSAITTSVYSAYSPLLNSVGMYVLPQGDSSDLAKLAPSANFPDWESLFGGLDFCTCEHCRSVYSPAAYLVDILAFLRRYQKDGKTALDVLFERRGDIGKIELNCHNTNTTLPYVDLINEILEHYLANAAAGAGGDWWNTMTVPQTNGQPADLRVHPENINDDAYQSLLGRDYPWTLPFNLWAEEARAYLTPLDIQREEIIRYFNVQAYDELTNAELDVVAQEHLGLIAHERDIILGNAGMGTTGWGGATVAQLKAVKKLLEKGRLSNLELRRVLNTTYVNGDESLAINFNGDWCDIDHATIPALTQNHLNRMHRFMRLARKLGWEITELDAATRALGATLPDDIDEAFLRNLSTIKHLGDALHTPLLIMLNWWAKIDTVRPKDDDDEELPSLYDNLFLNKSIGNEYDLSIFNLKPDRSDLANNSETLDAHEVAVLAALRLTSAEELALIRTKRLANATLNLHNLSELHRVATFAQALGLSIRNLLTFIDLMNLNPFDVTDMGTTLRFVEVLDLINESDFAIPELAYILYHEAEPNSRFRPANDSISVFLMELRDDLQKIKLEHQYIPDPTGELTAQMLAQVLPEGALTPAMGILYGLSAADMPAGSNTFIDDHFAIFLTDLTDAKNKLVDNSHADYLDPATKRTERCQVVLEPLMAYLLESNSLALVKQSFAEFLEIDLRAGDQLVGDLIKSISDAASPAAAEFLDPTFVDSSEQDISEANFGSQFSLVRRLHKTATIVKKIDISSDELGWLVTESPQLGWLDLNTLPVALDVDPARFQAWMRMAHFGRLRKRIPTGEPSLIALLRMAHTGQDDEGNAVTKNDFLTDLCNRTRWNRQDVDALLDLTRFNLTFNGDYQNENALKVLLRLQGCMDILKKLGVRAELAWSWVAPVVSRGMANEIKQAARAKYEEAEWLSVAETIRDDLRECQRKALVDAALQSVNQTYPEIEDIEDLYDYFLIDVEMNPCMITSRIKQAISSTQLFIQRCLMNLETEVAMGTDAAEQWKWMKNYRVWEANRKIFLYPENWTEPELRPEKSPFFVDLEDELLQNDVTDLIAENAYMVYLEKLDEVSRLEVAAVYNDEERDTLHVIGRTSGIPHKYYYRRWEKGRRWTPWEFVPVDVEGENVAVTFYNRRLYLFWFMIQEKATDNIDPTPLDANSSDNNIAAQKPKKYLEIKLVWSQYRQGKWSPKRLSDPVVTTRPSVGSRNLSSYRPRTMIREDDDNLLVIVEEGVSRFPETGGDSWFDKNSLERPSNFLFVNDGRIELVHYQGDGTDFIRVLSPFTRWEESYDYSGSIPSGSVNLGTKVFHVRRPDGSHYELIDEYASEWRAVYPTQYAPTKVSSRHLSPHLTELTEIPFFFQDRSRSFFISPQEIYRTELILVEPPVVSLSPTFNLTSSPILWEIAAWGELLATGMDPGTYEPSLPSNTLNPIASRYGHEEVNVVKGVDHIRVGQPFITRNALDAANIYGTREAITIAGDAVAPDFGTPNIGLGLPLMYMATATGSPSLRGAEATMFVMDNASLGYANAIYGAGIAPGYVLGTIQVYVGTKFRFHTFYHPYLNFLIKQLNRYGVVGILNPIEDGEAHDLRRQLLQEDPAHAFDQIYTLGEDIDADNLPVENFDFDYTGTYAIYNWELFFHIPFAVATGLSSNQRFEEAQKWFHFIFDPTDRSNVPSEMAPYRFWKIKPFYKNTDINRIEHLMRLLSSNAPADRAERESLEAQIADWRENPFQPHLIAQQRIVAYQKAVVMKYLDNIIAWGDHLFSHDTIESINEATQLYILAAHILGKRPEKIPPPKGDPVIDGNPVKTFDDLRPHLDAFSNALIQLETELPAPTSPVEAPYEEAPTADILGSTLFFCIPKNDKILGYWETVADRLFKIRNCMNIEGVVRQLNLFEPPIDPSMLVRAVASGVDLSSALNDMNAPLPHYRFNVILQKAIELCNDVRQMGGALLAALEKRDSEDIARVRTGHEGILLKAAKRVRRDQVEEAKETLAGLEKSLAGAQARHAFHAGRVPRIPNEKLQLDKLDSAALFDAIAQGLMIVKTALALIPQFDLGASGFGGSPVVKVKFGGIELGEAIDAASQVTSFLALLDRNAANRASIVAGYDRRQEEWDFQTQQALFDIQALSEQIEAAKIRISIAEKEVENQELQIEQNQDIDEIMRSKFTSKELYNWMVTQTSKIYFQSYQLAYDMAKRAQRAYQHELADYDASFVEFGYWDSLKKGLMAGDRLHYDLKRMEAAYYKENRREYELTKSISMLQLNPVALLQLRETGSCEIDIPEVLFNLDYSGHFLRRIKSVRLSIPCVTGPYTNVNCTLTLLSNRIRVTTDNPTAPYSGINDNRFISNIGGIQSIATSSAREDSGLFEINFHDERYLPFEGAGVISKWRLELSDEYRSFDYQTIADVILHLNYTAREGGESLRSAVAGQIDTAVNAIAQTTSQTGLFHFTSMKSEFSAEFRQFLHPVGTADHEMTIIITRDLLPILFQNQRHRIEIQDVLVLFRLRNAADYDDTQPLTLTISRNGRAEREQDLKTTGELPADLPSATYDNLDGDLDGEEDWLLKIKQANVAILPNALKETVDVGGVAVHRLKADKIEDIGLLLNYHVS